MTPDQIKDAAKNVLALEIYKLLQEFVVSSCEGQPTIATVTAKVYSVAVVIEILRSEMREMIRTAKYAHRPTMPSEEEFAKVDTSDLDQLIDAIRVLLDESGTKMLMCVSQFYAERN